MFEEFGNLKYTKHQYQSKKIMSFCIKELKSGSYDVSFEKTMFQN